MNIFTRVAKTGSFAAAADEMNISRAMVSKHVARLESKLGIRLLNRTTRKSSLTEAGRAYLERCLSILEEIEETELAVSRLQSEPRGTLKISAPPYFGTHHLIPAIAEYHRLYPDVHFETDFRGNVADLIEEGLDMAIRLDRLVDSNLIARNLASSELIVCGSPSYFANNTPINEFEDLTRHNCLINTSLPPGDTWTFKHAEVHETLKVSGTMRANLAGSTRVAAINGVGVAILPTYMVGQDLQAGRLKAVLTQYQPETLDIQAVYPHRKYLSAKVRTFVDFLCRQLQPKPYWDQWKPDNKQRLQPVNQQRETDL